MVNGSLKSIGLLKIRYEGLNSQNKPPAACALSVTRSGLLGILSVTLECTCSRRFVSTVKDEGIKTGMAINEVGGGNYHFDGDSFSDISEKIL